MSEESGGLGRISDVVQALYGEAWDELVRRARATGYQGALLRAYVDGLVDSLDSDQVVGILASASGQVPDDARSALKTQLLREMGGTDRLVDRDDDSASGHNARAARDRPGQWPGSDQRQVTEEESADARLQASLRTQMYARGRVALSRVPRELRIQLRPIFETDDILGAWLIGANGWLGGDAPIEHLDEMERLIELAHRAVRPACW